MRDFNPRAPCGARHRYELVGYDSEEISIHAPLVGRDPFRILVAIECIEFQSTRPLWGATRRDVA